MAPLHDTTRWYSRDQDSLEQMEPKSLVYVICEGQNTESYYFDALFALLNERRIPHSVEAVYCEKVGEDATLSHPKKLLSLALGKMQEEEFDSEDKVAIVFDADIYKPCQSDYFSLLDECYTHGIQPVVTFPSFEVFLLLHVEMAIESYILPNHDAIVQNEKVGKRRFVKKLVSDAAGCNPEHRSIGRLAANYERAIVAESRINTGARNAIGTITSNVGQFIQQLMG